MPLPRRNTPASLALQARITENLGGSFDLGGYLRRLARATVIGLALSACGQSHGIGGGDASMEDVMEPPPPPPPDPIWDCVPATPTVDPLELAPPELCDPHPTFTGLFWNPLPLFAEQGLDYAAVDGGVQLWEEGVRCGGASDPLACQETLDALFVTHRGAPGLFFTRGDEARFVDDRAEIIEMFGGRIATPEQAFFMLYLEGETIDCEVYASGAEVTEDGSFRVTVYRHELVGPATDGYIQMEYLVDPVSGEATLVESRIVEAYVFCGGGRRPPGFRSPAPMPATTTTPVGELFAQITHLEESSIAAFEVMIDELVRLGAPAMLIAGASAARADEIRHTASMGELARAYGVEPSAARVGPLTSTRTLFEIALENAVEGCVRETYGALVASHQALHARDPRVAAAMKVVSADEIRHAELSWALAAWLEPQLTDDDRHRIAQAKREAIAELHDTATTALHATVHEIAGMPTPEVGGALVAALTRDVWAS